MSKEKEVAPFKVGEEVLCAYKSGGNYLRPDKDCWRTTITRIEKASGYGSNWRVEVADSTGCKTCGHNARLAPGPLDSLWVRKLPQPKKRKPAARKPVKK